MLKRCILALLFINIFACLSANDLNEALQILDLHIDKVQEYDAEYKKRINAAKSALSNVRPDSEQAYDCNRQIYDLYRFYNADSALYYAKRNIDIAAAMHRDDLVAESTLMQIDILLRSGLFIQANELLSGITTLITPDQLTDYYLMQYDANQFLAEYVTDSEYTRGYVENKFSYADSILHVTSPKSFLYQSINADKLIDKINDLDRAETFITDALNGYQPGMREYSVLMSQLAYLFMKKGDVENAQIFLAKSAQSDIMGSVKENMAMRGLAQLRYDAGDIEHANRYLSKSFEDANFYSARMRNNQSAMLLPMINGAYNEMQAKSALTMKWVILLIGLIAVTLATSYILIKKKNRKLSDSNTKLHKAREAADEANFRLNEAYSQLEAINNDLNEANAIKETYLSQFIWLCSSALNNMEKYRKKLLTMSKKSTISQLSDVLSASTDIDQASAEFFRAFDKSFLSVFPRFIAEANSMLNSPLQSKDSKGAEILTTEQRIYALMRLGFTDNQKIAEFLHCSISTIYTYRSKVKSRAKNPAEFESEIMKIGR